ncbi:MAG: hypothetical protein ABG776_19245 [Cyanobacteria bacterium J06555_13]
MEFSEHQDSLLEYLEKLSSLQKRGRRISHRDDWAFQTIEDLLLAHALFMPPAPLPPEVERGIPKYCYSNTQDLLDSHAELTYVEGYAIRDVVSLPLPHAWLMTSEGTAVDPTWSDDGVCYFGIPLQTNWVQQFLAERVERYGDDDIAIIAGNYIEDYSLLQKGLPIESAHPMTLTHLSSKNMGIE